MSALQWGFVQIHSHSLSRGTWGNSDRQTEASTVIRNERCIPTMRLASSQQTRFSSCVLIASAADTKHRTVFILSCYSSQAAAALFAYETLLLLLLLLLLYIYIYIYIYMAGLIHCVVIGLEIRYGSERGSCLTPSSIACLQRSWRMGRFDRLRT